MPGATGQHLLDMCNLGPGGVVLPVLGGQAGGLRMASPSHRAVAAPTSQRASVGPAATAKPCHVVRKDWTAW